MRTLVLIAVLVFATLPKLTAQAFETYGADIKRTETISVDELQKMRELPDTTVTLEGTITATCAMKGCWMQLKGSNQSKVRVVFKNYSFFVPKSDQEGRRALVEGLVKRSMTSVETLRHYAKDAGKSDEEIASIHSPEYSYELVANGVRIYN